jgi:hypothetical protein
MKNFPRTFKVFYIFLVLCFILVSISSGRRRDKGYWMDVVISPIDLLCPVTKLPKAVLAVDTTDGCRGAFIEYAFKSPYINTLEHCFDLPEPLFPGSSIKVQSVEVGCKRDRHSGEIVDVQFWLKDTEQKYYRTEIVELDTPAAPHPNGFSISVNHCFRVSPQTGGGKKRTLGYLTVGTIEFRQK